MAGYAGSWDPSLAVAQLVTVSPFIEAHRGTHFSVKSQQLGGQAVSSMQVCKGKGCSRVKETGQSLLHLTALGERGLAREQQGPESSMG